VSAGLEFGVHRSEFGVGGLGLHRRSCVMRYALRVMGFQFRVMGV
jgi:hypothetical protein